MITTENFIYILTFLSLVYAFIIRTIQSKFMDQEKAKELNKKMNELNKEYFAATKSNNKKKMDEIQKKQSEMMPHFNKMLMGQLKFMGVVVLVFFAFMSLANSLDPFVNDDTTFQLTPSGDQFCGSFPLTCSSPGPWLVEVSAYSESGDEIGTNSTLIYCSEESPPTPDPVHRGTLFPITTDKKVYLQNGNAEVCITPPPNTYSAAGKTNSGTWFMVGLPFSIPVLNIDTLNTPNSWFIVVAIISGLLFSFVLKKIRVNKVAKKKG
jgi:hypothetical protein